MTHLKCKYRLPVSKEQTTHLTLPRGFEGRPRTVYCSSVYTAMAGPLPAATVNWGFAYHALPGVLIHNAPSLSHWENHLGCCGKRAVLNGQHHLWIYVKVSEAQESEGTWISQTFGHRSTGFTCTGKRRRAAFRFRNRCYAQHWVRTSLLTGSLGTSFGFSIILRTWLTFKVFAFETELAFVVWFLCISLLYHDAIQYLSHYVFKLFPEDWEIKWAFGTWSKDLPAHFYRPHSLIFNRRAIV